MKKFLTVITTLSLTATPAYAHDDPRWGVDANHHSPYYGQSYNKYRDRHYNGRRNGVSTEGAVAIGLGALIIGAVIGNSQRNQNQNYPVYTPRYVCQDVIQYDYYGNPYVAARNCRTQ